MRHAAVLTPILLLFLAPAVMAAVIHVPTDQPTIQAGIDAAVNGDLVLVSDGTWSGAGNCDLVFNGKAITVQSASGPAACIIDCNGGHRGFSFNNSGEGRDSVVRGFSITNANLTSTSGGAIYIVNTSPTIEECHLYNNQTAFSGGAVYCGGGTKSPLITGCRITGNQAGNGGGIFISSTSSAGVDHPMVTDCEISGNTASSHGGGVYTDEIAYPEFHNCLVLDNTSGQGGGAFYLYESHPRIYRCTVIGNQAGWDGGAICNDGLYAGGAVVRDSILRGNLPDQIWNQLFFSCSVNYCNVQDGYVGTGNIDSDPLLVSGPDGGHYLSQIAAGQASDSPCLDTGSDLASALCFETYGGSTLCLDQTTTRTDEAGDTGQVDMGYHYTPDRQPTLAVHLNCNPSSGTVPFSSNFGLSMLNQYPLQLRRMAAHIDLTLGNGQFYSNWRAGYTNLAPGQNLALLWGQNFPALPAVIGDNTFQLIAEDVTPSPFNQPPYPPAGDTATGGCTVTANW